VVDTQVDRGPQRVLLSNLEASLWGSRTPRNVRPGHAATTYGPVAALRVTMTRMSSMDHGPTGGIDRKVCIVRIRWIMLALVVVEVALFFAAGATSDRANGANTGPGAGAVSNSLFGVFVAGLLALIVLAVFALVQRRRSRVTA